MNKFMNDPANFVPEMLQGIFMANEDKLMYIAKYNCVMSRSSDDDHVSSSRDPEVVISRPSDGGGPRHAGCSLSRQRLCSASFRVPL